MLRGHTGGSAHGSRAAEARAGTVQDNILFDLDWSAGRYERAVAAASLHADLEQLPAGDQTELGEGVRLLTSLTYPPHSISRCHAAR